MRLHATLRFAWVLIIASLACPPLLRGADLQINELMAANNRTYADPQGQHDDWIEIHNTTDQPLDLAGLYLTDDINTPTRWQFPADRPDETTVAPGGFLIVWADDDLEDSGLHAGFKLSAGGEQVALHARDGATLLDSVTFGAQQQDISYGRLFNADVMWHYYDNPSPLAGNTIGYLGLVADTKFSTDRGFYDEPITVEITCATPDATIYYTLNGADPFDALRNQAQGEIYTGPLTISTTTCLRAAATREGWKTTDVDTHTYLFLADVIRQPARPTGYPTNWGHAGGDYAMDPVVVDDPLYQERMVPSLQAIASMSLVMNPDSWFGPDGEGIYLQGQNDPRAVSAELLVPDGEPGFQINCSVEIVGGSSPSRWKMDKLSLRLKFPVTQCPGKKSALITDFFQIDNKNTRQFCFAELHSVIRSTLRCARVLAITRHAHASKMVITLHRSRHLLSLHLILGRSHWVNSSSWYKLCSYILVTMSEGASCSIFAKAL